MVPKSNDATKNVCKLLCLGPGDFFPAKTPGMFAVAHMAVAKDGIRRTSSALVSCATYVEFLIKTSVPAKSTGFQYRFYTITRSCRRIFYSLA